MSEEVLPDRISGDEIRQLLETGEAVFVCTIGLQHRPIYLINGVHHYAKAIKFNNEDDDHYDDDCYYYIHKHIVDLVKSL